MSLNLTLPNQRQYSSRSDRTINLPRIEHPAKRFNENDKYSLDIRGKSNHGNGYGELIRHEITPRRKKRSSSLKYHSKVNNPSESLYDIPENTATTYGSNQDGLRLPIFGRKRSSSSSSSSINDNDKATRSSRRSKLEVDELEQLLREKIRSQMNDVKTKFRHAAQNDPNGKINRIALQHFIATIFGKQKQVSPQQIDQLLIRFNLKHSNQISFDEFLRSVFEGEEDVSQWISQRSTPRYQSSSKKTSNEMFNILKDKVRNRSKDLTKLIPSLNGGPSSRIFKAQFHNSLIDMGYQMNDSEFDKLWDRFDTDGFKAINSEKLIKILTDQSIIDEGILLTTREEGEDDDYENEIPSARSRNSRISNHENDPKTPRLPTSRSTLDENQVQNWLNHKFPNGFNELQKALERLDAKQTGTLPRDRFLHELKKFGFKLEPNLLEFFLKRLNVDLSLTNDGIPYLEVINAFKQKSDPTRKRINADNHLPAEESRQTALERQIDLTLSMNYERVRDLIRRLDPSNNGTISANEIRSIIEDLIEYTLKADEYYQLLQSIPMNEHGRIKYKEYLKQVLDRTLSRQEQQLPKTSRSPKYEFLPVKTNVREKKILPEQLKQRKEDTETNFNEKSLINEDTRSTQQLREMLKTLIRIRSKEIEDQFKKLDRGSYGELTPDLLYQLFKRLSIEPPVTRSEVDIIWSHCHLKRDGNLDFYQFLREFGYTKSSAHYPNAKRNPPKKGDADLILTSNRLYGDSVLVHGAALNIIRSKWDQLRKEFTELDPYRTGYIQSDEFDEIFSELCPSVNQEDLDILKSRFQSQNDSRINYIRFLKHHAPIPELMGLVDQANPKSLSTIHEKSPRSTSDRSSLSQVSNKLRRKLTESYKPLRRAFKQNDPTNSGSVPIKIFKQILDQHKCPLNDEEFYTLTSQIDTRMDGTINYNYFLQQYVKNT